MVTEGRWVGRLMMSLSPNHKKWREGETTSNNEMMKVKLVCVCKLIYTTELSSISGIGGIMHSTE